MRVKELFRIGNITLRTIAAFTGIILALQYPQECYRGIESGIGFCLEVLIPSLFFFMAASAYLVQSGVISAVCRPLEKLSVRLFGLPSEGLAVILLGTVGGYPVGAACTREMYAEGRLSASQAAKTAMIAVAAGPGFLINYVGASLLNSPQAGWLLLGAQATAVLLTGVIAGRCIKSEPLPYTAPPGNRGNLLVSAVQSASRSAFGMCAMVVIFSALIEVCDTVIHNASVCDITAAMLEITNGCHRIGGNVPLYITAFFIGFGGLSVHCQIFAILGDLPLNKLLFFLYRIIEGIFAMAAAYIYLMVMPMTTAVFSTQTAVPTAARSATAAGSAALVLSGILFIASISKRKVLVAEQSKDIRR